MNQFPYFLQSGSYMYVHVCTWMCMYTASLAHDSAAHSCCIHVHVCHANVLIWLRHTPPHTIKHTPKLWIYYLYAITEVTCTVLLKYSVLGTAVILHLHNSDWPKGWYY
jgi:hypothetical protein